ncbi:MAG: 7-cyano-7-deazaguanine synthase, partial [Duncaniella sp.]|nr:7-cyano-7-deazaguanine synthase [Duncaniella sp.]
MSESFSTRIKNFILRHHLLTEDDRVVVGLSGGADSVALLDVLHQLRYKCVAAHCNFHLRGEESMRDEGFCRELCNKLGIQLLTIDFDVEAQRNLTGESVEMACRTLR